MEQNDYEDTTIAKRDAALADIEKYFKLKNIHYVVKVG